MLLLLPESVRVVRERGREREREPKVSFPPILLLAVMEVMDDEMEVVKWR